MLPYRAGVLHYSRVGRDLTSERCLKLAVSKGLGLAMVAGGAILKLPQIVTVVKSGSARGLSLSSYVLDTAATA